MIKLIWACVFVTAHLLPLASPIHQTYLGIHQFGVERTFPFMISTSCLFSTVQVVTRQIELDEQVRVLVAMIERTYVFVTEARPIEKVEQQAHILGQISVQTFECVRFIVRYAEDASFCELLVCRCPVKYAQRSYFQGHAQLKVNSPPKARFLPSSPSHSKSSSPS